MSQKPYPILEEITVSDLDTRVRQQEDEIQLAWDFDEGEEDVILDLDDDPRKTGVKDIFAHIQRGARKYARAQRRALERDGHTIFKVRTFNDDISVEADYGAPAMGLDFYKELLDALRMFRYEPVRKVQGIYRTHVKQAIAVSRYFKRRGYKLFDDTDEETAAAHVHFVNGGVTSAFSRLVNYLVEDYKNVTEFNRKHGWQQEAVFLMPVPTYGLFLYSLEKILEGTGIKIREVRRLDNGAVDTRSLKIALDECRRTNTRVLGYYDCNPHNPSGHIRTEAETREVAEILHAESRSYVERIHSNYSTLEIKSDDLSFMLQADKPQANIVIMDDMAYEGLEHITTKKPFSFSQVSPEVAKHTVVLKGVSKIGIPGARIGLMLADPQFTDYFASQQLIHEFAASTLGVDIIAARYSNGPHQALFRRRERELRSIHRRKSGIIEAFVDGIDHTSRLTKKQKSELIKSYADYAGISRAEAKKIWSVGLPRFYISRDLEAGFFLTMNMEDMRHKIASHTFDDRPEPNYYDIRTGWGLYWAIKSFDIDVVPLVNAGADDLSLEVRETLSLPDKDLFRLFDNLRRMHDYFFRDEPDQQLDLFKRKPAFSPMLPPACRP